VGPGGIREGHGGTQQHDAHRQQSKFREHRGCHQGGIRKGHGGMHTDNRDIEKQPYRVYF